MNIYPGTVIEWLPIWASDGLRLVLWVGLIVCSIWMSYNAVRYNSPNNVILGRAALFLLFMQQAILHAQRWGQPISYESLIAFPALALVFAAMLSERRARMRQ